MTADPIAAIVARIIAKQAMIPVENMPMDATPAALGLDSLGLVEVVFALEEAFDIAIPFNANIAGARNFDISTVGSITSEVRLLVAAKTP